MNGVMIIWFLFGLSHAHSNDVAQRQHGERLFMNYCSGCHTLRFWSLPMVGLPAEEARRWFGKMPPDLSLTARERGAAWLTRYFMSFYPDIHQPFGSNNRLIPHVLMPNVLAPLCDQTGHDAYQRTVHDIVVFLVYVAEPTRSTRYRVGCGVIGFLCVVGLYLIVKKYIKLKIL